MLEIKNVSRIYGEGGGAVSALQNVSFSVEKGAFLAVMGPSGSGKSTLLNIIGGLDQLTSGEVLFDGQRIDNLNENHLVELRRNKIAYVFQQYHLIPSLTALENVMLPMVFSHEANDKRKALDILARVGLEKRASHRPAQLSGGEQQRVAIARAVVNDPELILADEPTGNMDQKTGNGIMDLLEELNREGRSIVMVTHAPDIAARAHQTLLLKDGSVVELIQNSKDGGNKHV
jgi:putative ABC transport system ATP-binding protein